MARLTESSPVYEAAALFRQRCLSEGTSLLWPKSKAWTSQNLDALRDAFVGHPDTGDRGFVDKWHDQLADQPADVHRVAADILAFYYLFPAADTASQQNKIKKVMTVVNWKLTEDPPDQAFLERIFKNGIGGTGTHYLAAQNRQVEFYLEFARRMLAESVDSSDPVAFKRIADEVRGAVPGSGEARHILLHLMFPERFEPIASEAHKRLIVETFKEEARGVADRDDALANIREALKGSHGGDDFDFYRAEVWPLWDPKKAPGAAQTAVAPTAGSARFWIEKTTVRGRPDRESGEYALGKALWSLQRGKTGSDIYRFMREVRPSDVVLHLTDSEGFTGVSRAAASVDESFGGIAGTEWGEGPSYLVRLRDFIALDPPLARTVFFSPPYRERLLELLRSGQKNLFYNSEPNLGQGGFLTPAPPALLDILDNAYRGVSGKTISELVGVDRPLPPPPPPPPTQLAQLVELTNFPPDDLVELEELVRDKKHVIFEGPPGSGKTYVAELLARYLTENPLSGPHDERMEIVQFHQSYGYEDFVQGIRPLTDNDGHLRYQVQDGIFKRFCAVAERNRQKPFVMVIDEINRGNISRILGELLLLLEYRDWQVPLPYALPSDPPFSIPKNIYLLGTMNTTDRSLAQVDYALRRRFYFYRLFPVVNGHASVLEKWLSRNGFPADSQQAVLKLFLALNQRVQQELGEHFQIGHSYFMDRQIDSERIQRRIWSRSIVPLLEEYFYGRRDRAAILSDFDPARLLTTTRPELNTPSEDA